MGLRDRLQRRRPGDPGDRAGGAWPPRSRRSLLHTLVYAAFLEDPLTWALLAIVAGLRTRSGEGSVPPDEAAEGAPTKGGLSPLGVTRA